jgi:hypothetical protein
MDHDHRLAFAIDFERDALDVGHSPASSSGAVLCCTAANKLRQLSQKAVPDYTK